MAKTTKDKSKESAKAEGSKGAPSAPVNPSYQVLARRYRSKDFDELVGQEAVARTLRNAIRTGRTAHAYLFTGTRGVGKTSMARIFARALNADGGLAEGEAISSAIMRGEDLDVIEIDAASNRGIDNARDLIAGAGLLPARGRYKIYIIDEVHMLTTPAFNALLKTMEEPPGHVKFILCTTEPQSVPATIQSRCQRFDFRTIPSSRIAEHLRAVLAGEGWEAEERVILQIARLANGSMRDALSLLERLLAAGEPGAQRLTWELLEEIFGLPDESLFDQLLEAIGGGRADDALTAGAALLERGLSIERSLDLLAERFRWLLLTTVCGKETELLEVAAETRDSLARVAELFASAGPPGLVHLIATCDAVAAKARDSSSPRALYDAALVRMAFAETFADATRLLAGGGGRGGAGAEGKKPPARAADQPARPANVVSAPPSQPAVGIRAEPKPAEQSRGGAEELDGEALWRHIERAATASPRDEALIETLTFRSCERGVLHVALRNDEAGAGFLAGNQDMLTSAIQRLAGRRIDVRLVVEAVPDAERREAVPSAAVPDAVREHPVVRRVAELFDAVVVEARPRRKGEAPAPPVSPTDDVTPQGEEDVL